MDERADGQTSQLNYCDKTNWKVEDMRRACIHGRPTHLIWTFYQFHEKKYNCKGHKAIHDHRMLERSSEAETVDDANLNFDPGFSSPMLLLHAHVKS